MPPPDTADTSECRYAGTRAIDQI